MGLSSKWQQVFLQPQRTSCSPPPQVFHTGFVTRVELENSALEISVRLRWLDIHE